MAYKFQFRDVFAQHDAIVDGLVLTLQLSAVTIFLGFVIGILVAAVLVYARPWARAMARAYVEVIRNTPLLVQLFLVFFGLPSLGLKLSADQAAIVALTFNFAAYSGEIVRGGIESIPAGQIEAAQSLGLSRREIFTHIVILPALEATWPSLVSQFVLMMLGSSVVSAIGADELTSAANTIQSRTFRPFEVFSYC